MGSIFNNLSRGRSYNVYFSLLNNEVNNLEVYRVRKVFLKLTEKDSPKPNSHHRPSAKIISFIRTESSSRAFSFSTPWLHWHRASRHRPDASICATISGVQAWRINQITHLRFRSRMCHSPSYWHSSICASVLSPSSFGMKALRLAEKLNQRKPYC